MVDFHEVSLSVDRKNIFYVNYVIQGYDGLAIVSTKDPENGLVSILYPQTSRPTLFELIRALQTDGFIKEVNEP